MCQPALPPRGEPHEVDVEVDRGFGAAEAA
jgi:hypothetical protein